MPERNFEVFVSLVDSEGNPAVTPEDVQIKLFSDDVGIAIHGARHIHDARDAFNRLASCAEKHLGCQVASYGLLVDDLDVYRAIVAHRPIGLAHPQSPAARALRDVAGMVLAEARSRAVV